MDAYKATLIPLGLMAALGLAYLAGRFLEEGELRPAPVETTTQAVRSSPPPLLARAPPGPARNPEREERLADIDYELAELPEDDAGALKALAEQIREEQTRLAGLRALLRGSDRALLLEAANAGTDPGGGKQLELELALSELTGELMSAKVAVAEQEWYLSRTLGSDDTAAVRELRAELAKRRGRVAELEARIRESADLGRESLDAPTAQRAARIQRWREERTALEAAYADSLGALAIRNQAYQRLAEESALARRRAEQLKQERKALGGEGEGLGAPAR